MAALPADDCLASSKAVAAPVGRSNAPSLKAMPWVTNVPVDTRRAAPRNELLGSPLFGEHELRPPGRIQRDESMLERLASTFTSFLVADQGNAWIGYQTDAVLAVEEPTRCGYEQPSRPSILSPQPQARDPPKVIVLPSAPEGCPVAGQPIPPQHRCAWCQTCEHPGPAVYLHLATSCGRPDDDPSKLREDNLQLHKQLREARTAAERAAQHAEQLKQQLEMEEHTRRQMESVVRRLKRREDSLERQIRLQQGYY
eukprot:COSAG02_NODE_2012_length_10118_cov_7.152111_7_plen_255_part_00